MTSLTARLVRRLSRPPRTLSIPVAVAVLAAAILVPATPSAAATSTAMTPACSGANLRASASVSGTLKTSLPLGAAVTVSGSVAGGAWSTYCPTAKSGSGWYRVIAVNGRSVLSAYGVSVLYAATGVLKAAMVPAATASPTPAATPSPTATPTPAPAAPTTTAMTPACSGANLRASASVSGTLKTSLPLGAAVTVSGTVSGGSWSTYCPTAKSGSGWYRVTAVNGRSVLSAYGVSALYAATGVLTAMPSAAANPADPLGTELIRLVNLDRHALGLSPYLVDSQLSAIARNAAFTCPTNAALQLHGRAQDMATRNYFSHTVPGCYLAGTTTPYPSITIVRSVFGYSLARSEIIHWNSYGFAPATYSIGCDINGANCVGGTTPTTTAVAVAQRSFMSSSVHRAEELAGYQRFGCGAATVPGTTKTYFACLFADGGSTLPSTSPSPSASPTPSPTAAPTASPTPTPTPTATPSPTPAATPSPTATPTPAPAAPTTTAMTPACSGANLRASASVSGTLKTSLPLGAAVTVSGTVSGGSWSTYCPTAKSGSGWYRVTAVNGRSVLSAYGVSALYAATGVLKAATAPTTLPSTVTFYGRGNGHGVGMSQYGAQGRALAGQSAATILAHYYAGTTIGSLTGNPVVRVLIGDMAPTATSPLVVYGRGTTWSISGLASALPAGARVRVYPTASGWRIVVDQAGTTLLDTAAPLDMTLTSSGTTGDFQIASMGTSYNDFRGSLRLIVGTTTVRVVNGVPMESYLRGVVPSEMPSGWAAAALQAQAIASRSYAAYRLHPATGQFDLYADTRSQVYLGIASERTTTDTAISATAGKVVMSGSAVADTLYHSSDGGATENNELVFVSATGQISAGVVSYLRGSSDRNASGVAYDAASPRATWHTLAYSIAGLSAIFAADSRTSVGTLWALGLDDRGPSGRLISVTLYGSSGMKVVSGSVFTAVFNAYSPATEPGMTSTLFGLNPIP